jgi:hypothetical protein
VSRRDGWSIAATLVVGGLAYFIGGAKAAWVAIAIGLAIGGWLHLTEDVVNKERPFKWEAKCYWYIGIVAVVFAVGGWYLFGRRITPHSVEATPPQQPSTAPPVPRTPSPSPSTSPKPAATKGHKKNRDKIETGDIKQGCGAIQVGGESNQASVNCGPPPLKLEYSFQTLNSGEQGSFSFDAAKCPVRTHMRIIPNQSVPPPIRVALDFDQLVSEIETTIENVGAMMGGGPFTVGLHAISSPISPGIGPHNPLIVEVCSDVPIKLTGEPHLVN